MEEVQEQSAPESIPAKVVATSRRGQKRKRRRSNEAGAASGAGSEETTALQEGEKRPRNRQMSVSSKMVANHVMKTRLLGSESDPLNLEGVGGGGDRAVAEEEECSTCAPSPVFTPSASLPHPPLLRNPRDPLNLEGQFPKHSTKFNKPGRWRRGSKRRAVSSSEDGRQEEGGEGGKGARGSGRGRRKRRKSQSKKMETSGASLHPPAFKQEDQRYHYGNYDMYYGYRCTSRGAMHVNDPRISLLRRDWFEGKECLDIGSNTGQVTLVIAQQFSPRRIVGIDIDHKLVRIANKNLFRQWVPNVAPDGRTFPASFTSMASFSLLSKARGRSLRQNTSQLFPNNVEFVQENYIPVTEEGVASTRPEYDVILALSITKWVHLNWGDAGVRRMFRKIFRHLRPGGRLVLEPQPFSSYARKKKLTPTIYKNYYAIKFRPEHFHSFLMSAEVGFSQHQFLGVPHHKAEGFRRPLHVYIKTESQPLAKDGGGGGGGQGEGRVGEGEGGGERMDTEGGVAGGEDEMAGEEGSGETGKAVERGVGEFGGGRGSGERAEGKEGNQKPAMEEDSGTTSGSPCTRQDPGTDRTSRE